ncbi:Pol [Symbiodinium sp. CCMP2592]|nr:Pol [Symbiodinium sp. CCMP2592]
MSAASLRRLTATLTKHLRAIMRIPAHLTHISTKEVWQRAGLPMPGWTIQQAQQQVLAKLEHRAQQDPDITTTSLALQHIRSQAATLEAILLEHPRQPHPRPPPYGPPVGQPPRQPPQDPLRLLTRVVLQQEEVISRLRHEKAFMLFMKQTEEGTLGSLMKVAKEWNRQKSLETTAIRSPLRTVLMSSMVKELLNLAQQAVATEENKARMIKAEWLTASSEWTYRRWCHTDRRLKIDDQRAPLQHAEAVRILSFLLENLSGDAIQRFGSTVQLPKLEQQGAQMATFALEISLRGKTAQELYDYFSRLCGNSLMSLIGVSMKKDTLPRSQLAKNLANQFYQR